MWYENPGWYALGLSLIALVASLLSFRHKRRITKSDIQRELARQATDINDTFARSGIRSPYGHLLKIPDERVREFNVKAVALLKQFTLLRTVYENRELLGEDVVKAYETWASTILRPWIEADEELREVFRLSHESKDMRIEGFNEWLKELLPLVR